MMTHLEPADHRFLDARRIRDLRLARGLSVEECSARTIDLPSFWEKLEAGDVREIDRQTVIDMAKTLCCRTSDLLSPSRNPDEIPDHVGVCITRPFESMSEAVRLVMRGIRGGDAEPGASPALLPRHPLAPLSSLSASLN